jgi:hypothetical protein
MRPALWKTVIKTEALAQSPFFTIRPDEEWEEEEDLGAEEWLGAEERLGAVREKEGPDNPELLEEDDPLGAENMDLDGEEKELLPEELSPRGSEGDLKAGAPRREPRGEIGPEEPNREMLALGE